MALTMAGQIEPAGVAQRIVQLAEAKTIGYAHYGTAGMLTVFVKAILCNWMVCFGVVMAMSLDLDHRSHRSAPGCRS